MTVEVEEQIADLLVPRILLPDYRFDLAHQVVGMGLANEIFEWLIPLEVAPKSPLEHIELPLELGLGLYEIEVLKKI